EDRAGAGVNGELAATLIGTVDEIAGASAARGPRQHGRVVPVEAGGASHLAFLVLDLQLLLRIEQALQRIDHVQLRRVVQEHPLRALESAVVFYELLGHVRVPERITARERAVDRPSLTRRR